MNRSMCARGVSVIRPRARAGETSGSSIALAASGAAARGARPALSRACGDGGPADKKQRTRSRGDEEHRVPANDPRSKQRLSRAAEVIRLEARTIAGLEG